MKKALMLLLVSAAVSPAYSLDFSLASLKASGIKAQEPAVSAPLPAAPAKSDAQVPQDLVYKFNLLRNELSRIESDTTWLRSDINRLESDARRIAQGSSGAFFSSDLRRMNYDMDRRQNDLRRLVMDLKNLLNLAQKDPQLNQIARDIEWDARDLDNRFQFDIVNAAQSLEYTVRGIDPRLIGYDAQWNASDLSRAARDAQWQTRDLRWDAQELVRKTQP